MNQGPLKRWLIASLVLNLFLACGIAGGVWRWWSVERAAGTTVAAQPRGLRFAADELSAEQRRNFRLGLRDVRRESAALIQTARDGRQEVLRLLNAPQLDHAALSAVLARTREADDALRARLETRVVDFATTLSQDERQKLASGLARRSMPSAPAAPQPKP